MYFPIVYNQEKCKLGLGLFGRYCVSKCISQTRLQGYVADWFGRALEWHSRGQRFDPAYLHQKEGHDASRVLLFGFRRPEGGGNLGGRRPQPSGRSPEPPFFCRRVPANPWVCRVPPRQADKAPLMVRPFCRRVPAGPLDLGFRPQGDLLFSREKSRQKPA